jgi:hypothetical protein
MRALLLTLTTCLLVLPAHVKYSGGTGEPNDPYQIATAADLIALGETPGDYDKHFILTADIDLDPNLPGRKVFDKAVIAPDINETNEWQHFDGTAFTGVFDGGGHAIWHLTITGGGYLGLFGGLGSWPGSGGEIKDLGIVDMRVTGSNSSVGGLVGYNSGGVTECYGTGAVSGNASVGGLVGFNGRGSVTQCYSTATVAGDDHVGGLVGENTIRGEWGVCGGGTITNCYSSGPVRGDSHVAGLVGLNGGTLTHCYSTGVVSGSDDVGGLVVNVRWGTESYGGGSGIANDCFWDIQTSGQTISVDGTGKDTAEMKTAQTFVDAGWDFVGEAANGTDDIWKIAEGLGYPRLSWEKYSGGTGESNDSYQIATAADLIALGETPEDYDKHFIMTADIDLDPNLPGRKVFDKALVAPDADARDRDFEGIPFVGVFDGNGHTISNFTCDCQDVDYVGLLGRIEGPSGKVRDLRLINPYVHAQAGGYIGSLVGSVRDGTIIDCIAEGAYVSAYALVGGLVGETSSGNLVNCHSTATVNGRYWVGGLLGGSQEGNVSNCNSTATITGDEMLGALIGANSDGSINECQAKGSVSGRSQVGGLLGMNDAGRVVRCRSDGVVNGDYFVGGLVGQNDQHGIVIRSCSTGTVTGTQHRVGGLVGDNHGDVADCYSAARVSGSWCAGGLVGSNGAYCGVWCVPGTVSNCYSSGAVSAETDSGGLVGYNFGTVRDSYWDTNTSAQTKSDGGEGKATAEMQTAATFLNAGWDFVDETANGREDIWWIDEGKAYPRLWWEAHN